MSKLKKKGTRCLEKRQQGTAERKKHSFSLTSGRRKEKMSVAFRPLLITRRFLSVTLGNLQLHLLEG